MINERDILIWLNSIGISNSNINHLLDIFNGDLLEMWYAREQMLVNLKNIRPEAINKIIRNRKDSSIEELLIKIQDLNVNTITLLDQDYPQGLKFIADKPTVLYYKGDLKEEDKMSIGIVGSRKATSYGMWACAKFTKELVNMGVTIVSGLALGIDTIAHKTALESGGRTIGVLGNGIDVVYPKTNHNLYNQVMSRGCVLTEFPLGTGPLSYNFPQRNRIISGLSLGVIVIEAKEKSGSLITAHHALEQGKDVFSLPGNINSVYSGGTNKLIKDGAKPLLSIDDIIEEIYELKVKIDLNKRNELDYTNLSATELKIVRIIEDGPVHCDYIVIKSGLNISTVTSILTILELKGIIKELSSRTFALN